MHLSSESVFTLLKHILKDTLDDVLDVNQQNHIFNSEIMTNEDDKITVIRLLCMTLNVPNIRT